jgi:hypothetical protein
MTRAKVSSGSFLAMVKNGIPRMSIHQSAENTRPAESLQITASEQADGLNLKRVYSNYLSNMWRFTEVVEQAIA